MTTLGEHPCGENEVCSCNFHLIVILPMRFIFIIVIYVPLLTPEPAIEWESLGNGYHTDDTARIVHFTHLCSISGNVCTISWKWIKWKIIFYFSTACLPTYNYVSIWILKNSVLMNEHRHDLRFQVWNESIDHDFFLLEKYFSIW